MNVPATTQDLFTEIRELILNARQHVATQVNTELLATYWRIGRMIVEHEQNHQERADYGKQVLKQLSKALTQEFGRGFSRSNLQNMRAFYLTYQKCQTLSGKLSWSHYCELLSISDPDKRSFYEKEAANSNWSVRELKRQIASSLFERLLLSKGDVNKEKVLALAAKGNEIAQPEDIIRDPYVFEFLGLPEDKPPIGIILCSDKDSITAEYALGGLSNNIFASRYVLYMPNKDQLIAQVENVLKKWHKEDSDEGPL